VFARGRIDTKSEEPAMLLEDVAPFQTVIRSEIDGIVVRLPDGEIDDELLETVAHIATTHQGSQKLLFEVAQGDDTFVIRTDARFNIGVTPELLDDLAEAAGPDSLSFTRR
jgi:hypothetical protein